MSIPSLSDLRASKYLTKEDCGEDGIIVTITGFSEEDLSAENEPCRMKWVLGLREAKPLVLNLTNIDALKDLFGVRPADWINKQVTLWNDESVMYKGEKKGGVRVYIQKAPKVAGNAAHQATIQNAKEAAGVGEKVPDHILEEQAKYQPPTPETNQDIDPLTGQPIPF